MQAAHVALLRELLLAQRRESLVRTATSLGLRLGLDLSWFSNIADEAVMAVASFGMQAVHDAPLVWHEMRDFV